jgi:hypothetical protein
MILAAISHLDLLSPPWPMGFCQICPFLLAPGAPPGPGQRYLRQVVPQKRDRNLLLDLMLGRSYEWQAPAAVPEDGRGRKACWPSVRPRSAPVS